MKQISTILLATIILFGSCKKDDPSTGPEDTSKNLPVLTTTEVTTITSTTAKSGGNVTNDGGEPVTSRGVCWSTTENPVVSGSKTTDGNSTGLFSSTISGLTAGTKYYVRAYATNRVGTSYGSQYSFTTTEGSGGTLTYNGHTYNIVTIGTQEWTVENLRTTVFNDGTAISKVTEPATWTNLKTSAYCAYNNDETIASSHGYLYNWFAVFTGKLAPATGGWRVPTDEDWTKLSNFIGSNAGTKLKAKSGWNSSGNGTDDYGFSALPGGYRNFAGHFSDLGNFGICWSSTEKDTDYAWSHAMYHNSAEVIRYGYNKGYGFSVRLVRDK